jgi:hypothetical protein
MPTAVSSATSRGGTMLTVTVRRPSTRRIASVSTVSTSCASDSSGRTAPFGAATGSLRSASMSCEEPASL